MTTKMVKAGTRCSRVIFCALDGLGEGGMSAGNDTLHHVGVREKCRWAFGSVEYAVKIKVGVDNHARQTRFLRILDARWKKIPVGDRFRPEFRQFIKF